MKLQENINRIKQIMLIEQPIGLGPVGGYDYQKPESVKKSFELTGLNPHTITLIAGIATAFIPVVGPFISAGIGLADAAMYYKEGDKKTAGMVGMFTLLPVIGPIVSKIPGIKQLGTKGMVLLAKKISTGSKITDPTEVAIVNGLAKNKELVKNSVNTHVKTLSQKTSEKISDNKIKSALLGISKTGLAYGTAGVVYNMSYNYVEKTKEEENIKKLNQMLGIK